MVRRASKQSPPAGPFQFAYDAYEDWYSDITQSLLEPARATFVRVLNEALNSELSELDRYRMRVSASRIKSPGRLWNKMLKPDYAQNITDLNSIFRLVDDLVGVRITCNNLSDVESLREILAALPALGDEEMTTGLCIEPESEKQYIENPKNSGYRAYHLNLVTLVAGVGEWKRARGELQVRTLLQDSWGELTHEDTYKPDTHMPRIVNQISRRMADLLATVDDLAQDLRNELDQMAREGVGDEALSVAPVHTVALDAQDDGAAEVEAKSSPVAPPMPDDVRQAVLSEIRRIINSLTRPATLAEVASRVQASFGREITYAWLGYGSFSSLLKAADPGVALNLNPPGLIIPSGMRSPYRELAEVREADIPILVTRLRMKDKNIPAVPAAELAEMLSVVGKLLDRQLWTELDVDSRTPGILGLNRLTKYGRDLATSDNVNLKRPNLDYLLKALYFSGNLRPELTMGNVTQLMSDWFFVRASIHGLVEDRVAEREELASWFEEARKLHEAQIASG